jgi:predicted TIM-barrel fold metal-dependent hydrolase
LAIIDCYTLLGAWPQAEADLSVETLAAGMQARGVTRSLVTHASAIFYDAPQGNAQLAEVCRQYEPLTPVAVINPLVFPECVEEIGRRLEAGTRVFRFCPREHGYPFSATVGPLREALRRLESAALILVDLAGLPAPAIDCGLVDLLPVPTAFTVDSKGLGVVAHAASQGPNVWVETSRLLAGGSVEAAAQHLGSARVIFGSGAPLRSLGSAVMSVQYAELAEADRLAIFEGNVQRLLA